MSNPLYNQFGNQPTQQPVQQNNFGLLGQINEFAKTVQNPEQTVRGLLASGQMSQEQFQEYAQMANMLMGKK